QLNKDDKDNGNIRSKLLIYMDNQAASRSTAKPKGKSDAYLLKNIVQAELINDRDLPPDRLSQVEHRRKKSPATPLDVGNETQL
ncbi:hypothetical protein BGZ61DRAFT_370526, partial [Ilyonectria robusta]|uniref:uncharacterized protein n=1 Tax=Ilyonectria robusta TaxID=1079257 RepID=UPI001E8E0144